MALTTRPLPYLDDETSLTGMLVWDPESPQPRPGLLLIHGGAGLDDHARGQAMRYAALGYVVLACDMFGDGVAGDRTRVVACLTSLRDDPDRLVRRGRAGLAALAACPEVNGRRAAIGFCFGGMAVLALARSGTELAAAVSVHGSLATSRPATSGSVTGRILVCHGAADPHVPMADVVALTEELESARADYQVIIYGGAVHGFTHEHAVPGAIAGVAYDARADTRSFAAIRNVLEYVLRPGAA